MIHAFPAVTTELSASIGIIRFNRPAERNPLSISTLDQLRTAFAELTTHDSVHAIVLTGGDGVFASGANIRELTKLDRESAKEFALMGQSLFHTIASCPVVTIAAINGFCMGGALDLALACDIRVASKDAILAHPGVSLGIITGWGGTQRLSRLIGRVRALELFLTARRLTSEEALVMGLVSGVSDPVLDYALEWARGCRDKGAAIKLGTANLIR